MIGVAGQLLRRSLPGLAAAGLKGTRPQAAIPQVPDLVAVKEMRDVAVLLGISAGVDDEEATWTGGLA